ncbi:uncharacterized protein LOC128198610 [Bicyclus anynana]|uniref:Uncharacterized protein LOC128198610 n=1 Tax=Bicyclus anynana TaxID=110368 RepID=A0ABM3LP13_BICAN|nr:uncharacterized protein LOC128198610 [Bicyclus anynana]
MLNNLTATALGGHKECGDSKLELELKPSVERHHAPGGARLLAHSIRADHLQGNADRTHTECGVRRAACGDTELELELKPSVERHHAPGGARLLAHSIRADHLQGNADRTHTECGVRRAACGDTELELELKPSVERHHAPGGARLLAHSIRADHLQGNADRTHTECGVRRAACGVRRAATQSST